MLKTVKKIIERAEFCHKIELFRDDNETNSNLKQCHCRNDIFVQKFFSKFQLVFRRTGCKFSTNKQQHYFVTEFLFRIICNLNGMYSLSLSR